MNQYIITSNINDKALVYSTQEISESSIFLKALEYCIFDSMGLDFIISTFFCILLIDNLARFYFSFSKYFMFLNTSNLLNNNIGYELVYSKRNIFPGYHNYFDNSSQFVQNQLKNIVHFNTTSWLEITMTIATLVMAFGFYCSYYYDTFGESFLDIDYLCATSIILAEKELGSVEDFLEILFILIFLFGWFFYTYGWSFFMYCCEILLVLLFIPLLSYSLLFVPACLIFDLSIMFVNYLRGVSTTSLFFVETIFDYIAIFAFLLRTFVQNVRYAIMLFVCYGVYEIASFTQMPYWVYSYWQNPHLIETALRCKENEQNYSLFIFCINVIVNSLYELAHAFFVLTVQFVSFLVMVFWLFSFLYTYFTSELLEQFFCPIRLKFVKKNL